jgi:hypothetical protein
MNIDHFWAFMGGVELAMGFAMLAEKSVIIMPRRAWNVLAWFGIACGVVQFIRYVLGG